MSSDLLEDVEDANGTSVMLTMNASGHATLTLMEDDNAHHPQEVDFALPPTEEGIRLAEKIEQALRFWREHIQTTILDKEAE